MLSPRVSHHVPILDPGWSAKPLVSAYDRIVGTHTLDFQFDETADLRRVKLLNIVDEFTREALAIHAARSIDADGVVATIERLIAQRGAPAHLRMDNGPEFVSAALRDWCRSWGTHTAHIEPGSPHHRA